MNNIYLKYYLENTRKILEDDLGELTTYKYLKYTKDNCYELKNNVFIGKVDKKSDFAFLLQENEDLYIDKKQASNLMDGDIILVEVKKGKAVVQEVLERGLKTIIAKAIKRKNDFKYFTDKPLGRNILVDDESSIVNGSIVRLKVENIKNNRIYANLDLIIGHETDPNIDILKIVASYNWPETNMEELEKEAALLKPNLEEEIKHRRDLTDKLVITIDGEDAKDLDDAISLEVIDDNYHLGIHIADVSYYVKRGSEIDKAAYNKSTSVYMANTVIPMLPRKLANDFCSLNPHEDKLTLSCLMVINKEGRVIDYELTNSIVRSKFRLTYNQVNNYLNNDQTFESNDLNQLLTNMNDLSIILKKLRHKRGELNFTSEELSFIFDKNNNVVAVVPRKTDVGEELIESFMLVANETVAFHMEENGFPGIYRVHEKPETEKLEQAIDVLSKLNIEINKRAIHNVKTFQNVLKDVKASPHEYLANMTLLRAMKKAKYSNYPLGHFGLAARYYAHFTSPIRRYPDLILHRLIKELVLGENNNLKNFKYYEEKLEEIAKHTSNQERTAVNIERDVNQLMSCKYMLNKVGEEFFAQIIQIMKTGFFVRLNDGIEGFVNVKNNYRVSSYEPNLLAYKINDKLYKIGDLIKVELTDVDMLEYKIDFILIEGE